MIDFFIRRITYGMTCVHTPCLFLYRINVYFSYKYGKLVTRSIECQSRINFISRVVTNSDRPRNNSMEKNPYCCCVVIWIIFDCTQFRRLFNKGSNSWSLPCSQGHSRPITNSCIQKLDCGIIRLKTENRWLLLVAEQQMDCCPILSWSTNKYFKACPAVCPSK